MAEIITQNLGTEDAFSPLIVGLNEAVSKLSKVLDFKVATLSDAKLTNVPTEDDFKNRIYESSNGNRLWLASPAPVIKKNGSVITTTADGFEIDYVGGAIYFSSAYALKDSDVVTVSCSYIIADSQTLEAIRTELSKCVKTFCGGISPDENGDLDPTRPMLVGSGASVGMESTGDRIHSVTAHGFTEQAGTGDPSPTNVRQITVGGKRFVKFIIDGSNGREGSGSTDSVFCLSIGISIKAKNGQTNPTAVFSSFKNVYGKREAGYAFVFAGGTGVDLHFDKSKISTADAAKQYLKNNPVTVWYEPAYETQATGIYTPIVTDGEEYNAVCVPITAPLCEGDTIETCVKSGCDKKIVYNGAETESYSASGKAFILSPIPDDIVSISNNDDQHVYCDRLSRTGAGNTWGGKEGISQASQWNKAIQICVSGITTSDGIRNWLKENPITVWYRTTKYTPEKDILVLLETHKNAYREYRVADMNSSENYPGWKNAGVSAIVGESKVGDVKNAKSNATTTVAVNTSSQDLLYVRPEKVGGLTQSQLKEQYHDLIFQFVIPYLTPVTYAHDHVYIEAYPDGNGKFTVSGENTIDLYAKPFTNASTLDGKHADDFATADHVHNYAGSSSAGGAANTALACTGNSNTATKLQTARTINGTSFDGSANITTANWGTSRNITIGNSTKSVNGSQNISYSLSDIGAMSIAGNEIVTVQATEFGGSVITRYSKVEFKKFGRFVDVLVEVLIDNVNANDTYEVCSLPNELSGLVSESYMGSCISGDNTTLYEHIARVSISSGKIWTRFAKGGLGAQYVKTHFMCFI